jgi:hypothetical protein
MAKPSSDTSAKKTEASNYAKTGRRAAVLRELQGRNLIPRALAIKAVEKVLYGYAEQLAAEMVALALDPEADERARANVLLKAVEMIRPLKQAPMIVNKNKFSMTSHLNVPMGEVGPETQPAIDVPPLREIEGPIIDSEPVIAGDLERERRAPGTAKEVYGKIPVTPQQAEVLEAEYSPAEERLGAELPQRHQSGPVAKVVW